MATSSSLYLSKIPIGSIYSMQGDLPLAISIPDNERIISPSSLSKLPRFDGYLDVRVVHVTLESGADKAF